MRKVLKLFHSLASCGLIGALLGYTIVLIHAPQTSPLAYAQARQIISLLCNFLLLPSLAVALVTGLFSMMVHRPFQDTRWAWFKAVLGLSMFEATLGIIQSKATTAAVEFGEDRYRRDRAGRAGRCVSKRVGSADSDHGVVDCSSRTGCVATTFGTTMTLEGMPISEDRVVTSGYGDFARNQARIEVE